MHLLSGSVNSQGNDTQFQRCGEEVQLFARNEGCTIIIMVLHSMHQCDNNVFFRQYPMPIRGAGLNSMVRRNYLQDVLGDFVAWDLVALLVRTLNTASYACTVLSKRLADRENYICCVTY